MAGPGVADSPWRNHRRRAEVLRTRFPFAVEMLTLYLALLDVWEEGWQRVGDDRPEPTSLPQWTVENLLPGVVKATEAAGPEPLAAATGELVDAGGLADSFAAWLGGQDLPPVERYLARAALSAPLVGLDQEAGTACAGDPSPRGGRRCPRCGALPQLSFHSDAGEGLVTGGRRLSCVRCGHSWAYSASSCPSCGETTGSRRTVYAERHAAPVVGRLADDQAEATLPHLRIEACATCQQYVIDVDLSRDPQAVPEVDELAALPLDLHATEQGLTKVAPNLMGF